jgi:hypothetical protein
MQANMSVNTDALLGAGRYAAFAASRRLLLR